MVKRNAAEIEAIKRNANRFLTEAKAIQSPYILACEGELHLKLNAIILRVAITEGAPIAACREQFLQVYLQFQEELQSLELSFSIYRDVKNSEYCQWFYFEDTESFVNGLIDGEPLTDESYDQYFKGDTGFFDEIS